MWELDYKESWAPKNWCFQTLVMEKTLESPLEWKGIQGVQSKANHWKDWCWSWNSNTLATWCEELTHIKRPWCWERLKEGGEGDDRGWNGWMPSPTQWIWVWVTPGFGDGQGGPMCCSPGGCKESDMTERLNWTEVNWTDLYLLPSLDSWFRNSPGDLWLQMTLSFWDCRGSWALLSHYVLTLCPTNHRHQPTSSNFKLGSQWTWHLLFILDLRRAVNWCEQGLTSLRILCGHCEDM